MTLGVNPKATKKYPKSKLKVTKAIERSPFVTFFVTFSLLIRYSGGQTPRVILETSSPLTSAIVSDVARTRFRCVSNAVRMRAGCGPDVHTWFRCGSDVRLDVVQMCS